MFFSKSTADSTGLLDTEIGGKELGVLVVFLELQMRKNTNTSYSSSLLLGKNSKSTSDVLADNLDLSKLGRSSTGDLSNTELN